MTTSPPTTRLTLRGSDLATALRAVRYAVSDDPELPMLGGVLLELDEGGLTAAATDRYRLAVRAVQAHEVAGTPVGVVAPRELVDDVVRRLAGEQGPVVVVVSGDELAFEAPGVRLSGQRLDVEFPDYRRLLRTGTVYRIPVQVDALRRQLAATPTRVVRGQEDGIDHAVTVLTVDADGVLGFGDGPGDLVLGVNGEFLLQAVDASGAGQLVLELDGPVSPLALRDPQRPTDVDLLMPVRLS